MLACEKSTSLAELFSVELKFTVVALNHWFSRIIKPKFFDLDDNKKQIFVKENPIDQSKTMCSICGFSLNVESDGWFDFVVKCEHLFLRNIYNLFLRNIYNFDELQQMDIETEEKYSEILYRLLEFYPLFEKAHDDGDASDEVRNFLVEDLNDCYETFNEVRNDIQHVSLPKKEFSSKKYSLKNYLLITFLGLISFAIERFKSRCLEN